MDFYLHQMASLEERFPERRLCLHDRAPGRQRRRKATFTAATSKSAFFAAITTRFYMTFADIERFDPDGVDYLAKGGDFGCYYRDGNGNVKNWAEEWCRSTRRSPAWPTTARPANPSTVTSKRVPFGGCWPEPRAGNPKGAERGRTVNRGTSIAPTPKKRRYYAPLLVNGKAPRFATVLRLHSCTSTAKFR